MWQIIALVQRAISPKVLVAATRWNLAHGTHKGVGKNATLSIRTLSQLAGVFLSHVTCRTNLMSCGRNCLLPEFGGRNGERMKWRWILLRVAEWFCNTMTLTLMDFGLLVSRRAFSWLQISGCNSQMFPRYVWANCHIVTDRLPTGGVTSRDQSRHYIFGNLCETIVNSRGVEMRNAIIGLLVKWQISFLANKQQAR